MRNAIEIMRADRADAFFPNKNGSFGMADKNVDKAVIENT